MENHAPASAAPAPREPQGLGDFDKRLIGKIKEEKLNPKPRWQFLFKNYVIWLSGLLSLMVGAAAIAVMIYLFQNNDWELVPQLGFWELFVITLPYFWIVFLGLFIFILNYNFRHTERGYRYPIWMIAGGSVVASLALGGLLYAGGWGEKIDNTLAAAPYYDRFINRNVVYWHKPEGGRLAGVVEEAGADGRTVTIIDPLGRRWEVVATSMPAMPRPGEPVKVLGRPLEDGRFEVRMIRPMHAGRAYMLSRPMPPGHPRDFIHPAAAVPGEGPMGPGSVEVRIIDSVNRP